ncbi:hypothetical protein ACIA74_32695 [Streptomyces sp. NPDC051658]|uniref:hypothetical protein n=1 Tax=unclassified Streptomyces TaxID=2593676 RepID=UPI00225450E4|nr:hypothetical protein [Streptomyces sp. NBC_00893]MCX4851910.1 hypothetical protein [Streptomyces sp. NBC_00893]
MQTLCPMDEFDGLMIEDLVHGSHWAPPTDVFVCWTDAPFTAPVGEVRQLAHRAA